MNVRHVLRWSSASALLAITLAAAPSVGAQNAVITGRVTSEDGGIPLEGANVIIPELQISVGTNASGRYRIAIPGERVRGQTVALRVRFIGHTPASSPTVVRAGDQTVDFVLKRDIQRLSEVVTTGVIGATEQAKSPITVTRIDAASLPVPAANALSLLKGKVPGANIVEASGRPGAQPNILLRGPKSINASGRGQDPLFIVDGIILNGPLPDINPLDIESIEVVAGAAASSLYGARAGNGVIQITTKRGKNTGENVDFNIRSEFGVSDIEREIGIAQRHALIMDETGRRFCNRVTGQPLCAATFDYLEEQKRVNNLPADFADVPAAFPVDPGSTIQGPVLKQLFQANRWPGQTYNAVDQFVKPRPFVQNSIDMSGRFGNTGVYASLARLDQGGSIRFLNGYERNSVRLNVDQTVGDAWSVALSTYYSRNESDGFNQEDGGGAFFRLTRVPAIVNLLQTDTLGRLFIRPNLQGGGQQNENPLYSLQNIKREDIAHRFLGGLTVRYTPLAWLDFAGNASYDVSNRKAVQFVNKGFRTTVSSPTGNLGSIFRGTAQGEAYNASVDATVRHDFGRDLLTRTTFRYLYEQQDADTRTLNGLQLAVVGVTSADNATASQTIASGISSVRGIGMFAGVNLEYKERYIADALIRRDGSSLFGSENRWATFGRGSLAWRVAAEPWWFVPQINDLKLRGSYGTAGGRPNFSAQYETFTIGTGGVLTANVIGNKNLRPEITSEAEVGIDLGVLSRFTVNATYSHSDTKDQILPVPVPSSTGFATQWQNAGTLQNKTFELGAEIPIIDKRDFTWSTRVSYNRNRTTITRLDVPEFDFGTNLQGTGTIFKARQGERYGTFYGRKFLNGCAELPVSFRSQCGGATSAFQVNDDGYLVWVGAGNSWQEGITKNLWQTNLLGPQAPFNIALNWGMPILLHDSLGAISRVPLGNALPDYKLALSQSASYKRLSVYALLDASIGNEVYNEGRHWSYLDFLSKDIDQNGKTVQTAKPIGYYYRAAPPYNGTGVGGFYDILGPNNHFVEDASYTKLREASVAYHIGPVARTGDWTVSVIGRNLYTWTDYKGFDPEVGVTPNTTSQAGSGAVNAVDAFTFPNLRTLTFTIATTF